MNSAKTLRSTGTMTVSGDGFAFVLVGNCLFALTFVGFPVVASLTQIVGEDSNIFSIIYRITYLLIAGIVFAVSISRGYYRLDPVVAIFISIYSLRIAFEYWYGYLPSIYDDAPLYLGTVLLPLLLVGCGRGWYQENVALWFFAAIGFAGNVLALYALHTGTLVADVATADTGPVRAGLSSLNPISLGYDGLFTAAAAAILLIKPYSARIKFGLAIVVMVSIYVMVVAASRGPFVALALGALVTALANRRVRISYIVAVLFGLALFVVVGLPDLIVQRFETAGQDASSLERFYAIHLAISEAMQHPLLGYAYIEPVTGIYPHNLLVESGLALGVAGVGLMLVMQFSLISRSIRAAYSNKLLLAFIAATQFADAWISASLWGGPNLYIILGILYCHARENLPINARRSKHIDQGRS